MNEKEAPDYYRFVDEDKEMWLGHVAHKTSLGAYSSVAEFTADVQQIAANCKAYNSASGSKNGNKGRQLKLVRSSASLSHQGL